MAVLGVRRDKAALASVSGQHWVEAVWRRRMVGHEPAPVVAQTAHRCRCDEAVAAPRHRLEPFPAGGYLSWTPKMRQWIRWSPAPRKRG